MSHRTCRREKSGSRGRSLSVCGFSNRQLAIRSGSQARVRPKFGRRGIRSNRQLPELEILLSPCKQLVTAISNRQFFEAVQHYPTCESPRGLIRARFIVAFARTRWLALSLGCRSEPERLSAGIRRRSTRQSCRVESSASRTKPTIGGNSARQVSCHPSRNSADPNRSSLEAAKWTVDHSSALGHSR
jgi:hypothetical protein